MNKKIKTYGAISTEDVVNGCLKDLGREEATFGSFK